MPDPKPVFILHERKTGAIANSYSRAYHDETEFQTAESARSANCHDIFQNREKYRIAKYRVVYELIEPDVK